MNTDRRSFLRIGLTVLGAAATGEIAGRMARASSPTDAPSGNDPSGPATPGQLNFDDFADVNNDKAVGGRIGFEPFTDLSMGYSVQLSRPSPSGVPECACVPSGGGFPLQADA
jgi:hypothetical protein